MDLEFQEVVDAYFQCRKGKRRTIHALDFEFALDNRIIPSFIRDSFACLKERGTLDGSNRLHQGMRSITRNWQQQAYYLSADVRNFFIIIHKPTLWKILEPKIVETWLKDLTLQVLFHDPTVRFFAKSSRVLFNGSQVITRTRAAGPRGLFGT